MKMTTRALSDGRKVSLLGYGAMRLPTVDGGHANNWKMDVSKKAIDQELLNRQVRLMLDGGVNYFDTSPAYCRGESESALGTALVASGYRRGDYILATKLSNFSAAQHSLRACQEMFAKSLKALRTDYIDNYLLHSIGNGGFKTFSKRYLENGVLDWLCELREKRIIRNLGFSYHGDPKTWEWCMEHHGKYKWDFAQIQLNYYDWKHAKRVNARNLDAKKLYDDLVSRNIPAVVMEPLLGGLLAKPLDHVSAAELVQLDPEATHARWALRFCGTLPNVMTVISGMTFTEHIEENIETFSPLKPCSAAELDAIERTAVRALGCKTLHCTQCNYCMPCPYGLDIPALFAFRNDNLAKDGRPGAKTLLKAYAEAVPEELRRADHCTGCGRCQSRCPQQIDIPAEIASLDAIVDALKSEAAR